MPRPLPSLLTLAVALLFSQSALADVGAIAPTTLIDPTAPDAAKQLAATRDGQASFTLAKEGVTVSIKEGPAGYPGIEIVPAGGKANWDFSAYGRIDAKITNTGAETTSVTLRIDNAGDWRDNPWNAESTALKPGATKTIKLYFGHSFGGKPGYKLNSGAITKAMLFTGKANKPLAFRIDEISATGVTGEKPPVDPSTLKAKPAGGVIFGANVPIDPVAQLIAKGSATIALDPESKAIKLAFAGKKGEAAHLKFKTNAWSMADYHQVRVKIRNTGDSPARPRIRLENKGAQTDLVSSEPIPAGETKDVVVSFIPAVPWQGTETNGKFARKPGTGTDFRSNFVTDVVFLPEENQKSQLLVTSIVGEAPAAVLPDWLGKRPPVEGDWTKTLDENFDGDKVDLKTWNIYTSNFWDRRSRFSKDNVLIKDGKASLRFEKKTGFHNDDPNDKGTGQKDYTTGFLDGYGKWTQRYGYFEARMKLPRSPGLWPAFWLMPDRGVAAGPQWKRASTSDGGMETDIVEFLSGWGPYRYNIAMHWDGYGKQHKAIGSSMIYAPADAEGYITGGLLWTPGSQVFYANGKEVARWENPRICSIQSYIMFTAVSGGWDNEPLDDKQLPDDFILDYVRVWQRKDLATAEDGPKPNDGGPASHNLPTPGTAPTTGAK